MVVEDQYLFTTSDGVVHPVRRWSAGHLIPKQGTVLCIHGVQSHSGWYRWSSRQLAGAGWDVNFLDRRGSGRSDQPRGDAPSAERLIEDVVELAREIHDVDAPLVLLGLSWGARLASIVAARHPELFRRLVLLYPGIYTEIAPTKWQRRALMLANWLGAGRRTIPIPLDDPSLFTSDPDWQQYIRQDFLALHAVTLRFLKASELLAEEARAAAERIQMPALVLLAERDRVVDNEQTRLWFERVPIVHKEIDVVAEAAHTFEFERNRDWFVERLINWLNHVPPSPVALNS
jgi:acylglycerol lipase